MPQIPVVEETTPGVPGDDTGGPRENLGGPVIGGIQVRRPTSLARTPEGLREEVVLGSGDLATYDRGIRFTYALSWEKLTEADRDQLHDVTADPYTTYAPEPGAPAVVVTTGDGLESEAVPGTFPIRYSASLTLRERSPRTT